MPAALSRRVEGVRLYAPNLRSLSLRSLGDYFLTTDTPNVMRWLADRMRAAGVELRLMQSFTDAHRVREIGRASCRERVCQDVSISVGAVSLKTQQTPSKSLTHTKDSDMTCKQKISQ